MCDFGNEFLFFVVKLDSSSLNWCRLHMSCFWQSQVSRLPKIFYFFVFFIILTLEGAKLRNSLSIHIVNYISYLDYKSVNNTTHKMRVEINKVKSNCLLVCTKQNASVIILPRWIHPRALSLLSSWWQYGGTTFFQVVSLLALELETHRFRCIYSTDFAHRLTHEPVWKAKRQETKQCC